MKICNFFLNTIIIILLTSNNVYTQSYTMLGSADTITSSYVCQGESLVSERVRFTNGPNQNGFIYFDDPITLEQCFDGVLCLDMGQPGEAGHGIMIIFQRDFFFYDTSYTVPRLVYETDSKALVIELDTYTDPEPAYGDTEYNFDHLTLSFCDSSGMTPLIPPVRASAVSDEIEDGINHFLRLKYDSIDNHFQVFFDEVLRMSIPGNTFLDYLDSHTFYAGALMVTGALPDTQFVAIADFETDVCFYSNRVCVTENEHKGMDEYFRQYGNPDAGTWVADENSVRQLDNKDPTFFITIFDMINTHISFNMRALPPSNDRDQMGFVFGLSPPDHITYDYFDMWLFDWRGHQGDIGYSLSRVEGVVDPLMYTPHFHHHQNGASFDRVDSMYNDTLAWELDRTYLVELTYTDSYFLIQIDGETIFEEEGCFEAGRFGFFNYSQANVLYSDFDYTLLQNFTTDTIEICQFDSVQFQYPTNCSGEYNEELIDSLIWTFGDGDTLATGAGTLAFSPNHIYDAPGVYEVQLRRRDIYSCEGSTLLNMTVYVSPVINLPADTNVCHGDLVYLNANQNFPKFVQIQWEDGSSTSERIIHEGGAYAVTATSNDLCSVSSNINVTYIPDISWNIIDTIPTCFNNNTGEVILEVIGGSPPYDIYLNGEAYPDFNFTDLPEGEYHVRIVDSNHCNYEFAFSVATEEIPEYEYGVEDISCFGLNNGCLKINSTNVPLLISLDGINYFNTTEFCDLPPGTHDLYLQTMHGCILHEEFYIYEPPLLAIDFPEKITVKLGDTLFLSAPLMMLADGDSIVYKWADAPWISCTDCPNPKIYPLEDTNYALNISNQNACRDSITIQVTVDKSREFYLGNIFSPNDDLQNDIFFIQSGHAAAAIKQINHFRIYDKYGAVVFEARNFLPDNKTFGWDGKHKNKPAPEGVYLYTISYSYIDGRNEDLAGDITLIR